MLQEKCHSTYNIWMSPSQFWSYLATCTIIYLVFSFKVSCLVLFLKFIFVCESAVTWNSHPPFQKREQNEQIEELGAKVPEPD